MMQNDDDWFFYLFVGVIFYLTFCTGCAHQTPVISTDARKVIKTSDIINPRDLSEEEAMKIYVETGVYRGLTDEEWIHMMKEAKTIMEGLKK